MKKSISIIALSLGLLIGATSCSKDTANSGETGTGTIALKLEFGANEGTRAAVSTAIPGTAWGTNIKSLNLFIVDASGIIKSVVPITLGQLPSSGIGNSDKITLTGVTAGANMKIYAVANMDQASSPVSTTAGVTVNNTAGAAWLPVPTAASWIGTNIANLTMALNTFSGTAVGADVTGSVLKNQPSEIFIATSAAFTLAADQTLDLSTAPLMLKRGVSLLRVRVDRATGVINAGVDFTDAKTVVRIRRHGQGLNFDGTSLFQAIGTLVKEKHVLYLPGALSTTNSPAGYTGDMGLGADFYAYKDYLFFPGGSATTSTDKYDIVIGAMAPIGYMPAGESVALTTAKMVYWQGAITKVIVANKVVELNLTIKTAGALGGGSGEGEPELPLPVEYGSLEIMVGLTPWDAVVVSEAIPL